MRGSKVISTVWSVNRALLAHQLTQPRLDQGSVAPFADVEPVVVAGWFSIHEHAERQGAGCWLC